MAVMKNDLHKAPSAQQTTRNLQNINIPLDDYSGLDTPIRSLKISRHNQIYSPIKEESTFK